VDGSGTWAESFGTPSSETVTVSPEVLIATACVPLRRSGMSEVVAA
jgi:hypothetical protein